MHWLLESALSFQAMAVLQERSAARHDTRAGHCERNLQTKAGEVRLRVRIPTKSPGYNGIMAPRIPE